MSNIWSSLCSIQVANECGPSTSFHKNHPQRKIRMYGSTYGMIVQPPGENYIHPLGAWIALTHRRWIWYYESSNDDLPWIKNGKVHHFLHTTNYWQTRSSTNYKLVWVEDIPLIFKRGVPTSVVAFTNTNVNKLNKGVPLAKKPLSPTDFWEFLNMWERTWMWEGIDENQQTKNNLKWLVEGMESNTLIWVTDGSYDRKRAALLCGVSWIIFCSKTGLGLTGTFWERSPAASSYRAEMLGLCARHLFARAFSEFYKIQEWEATVGCNNERALEQSLYSCRRIRPSAKCADIQRSIKATKHTFTGKFTYLHVYGHMDKCLLWHQLSLIQQLNWVCDTLIKQAVTSAMMQGYHNRSTQLLSKEDVAVVIWGNKIIKDVSHPKVSRKQRSGQELFGQQEEYIMAEQAIQWS